MKKLVLLSVSMALLWQISNGQQHDPNLVASAPTADRDFRCKDLVQAVDALQSLGKEKAIAELQLYADEHKFSGGSNVRVVIICRLLFVNPNGWERSEFGQPFPIVNQNAITNFPSFPIAVVDGVPFLLVEGYEGSGLFDSPSLVLTQCKNYIMTTNRLTVDHIQEAGSKLINSKNFRDLYKNERDYRVMTNRIQSEMR